MGNEREGFARARSRRLPLPRSVRLRLQARPAAWQRGFAGGVSSYHILHCVPSPLGPGICHRWDSTSATGRTVCAVRSNRTSPVPSF